jgi:hypothetical protein
MAFNAPRIIGGGQIVQGPRPIDNVFAKFNRLNEAKKDRELKERAIMMDAFATSSPVDRLDDTKPMSYNEWLSYVDPGQSLPAPLSSSSNQQASSDPSFNQSSSSINWNPLWQAPLGLAASPFLATAYPKKTLATILPGGDKGWFEAGFADRQKLRKQQKMADRTGLSLDEVQENWDNWGRKRKNYDWLAQKNLVSGLGNPYQNLALTQPGDIEEEIKRFDSPSALDTAFNRALQEQPTSGLLDLVDNSSVSNIRLPQSKEEMDEMVRKLNVSNTTPDSLGKGIVDKLSGIGQFIDETPEERIKRKIDEQELKETEAVVDGYVDTLQEYFNSDAMRRFQQVVQDDLTKDDSNKVIKYDPSTGTITESREVVEDSVRFNPTNKTKDEIKARQRFLENKGYYLGPTGVDGDWGEKSMEAETKYLNDLQGGVLPGMGTEATTPLLEPFNRGGYLPGNDTGDKNPAMLEDGEYVLNREAVKKVGKGFLDWINNEKYPRFGNTQEMQHGGYITGRQSDRAAIARQRREDDLRKKFYSNLAGETYREQIDVDEYDRFLESAKEQQEPGWFDWGLSLLPDAIERPLWRGYEWAGIKDYPVGLTEKDSPSWQTFYPDYSKFGRDYRKDRATQKRAYADSLVQTVPEDVLQPEDYRHVSEYMGLPSTSADINMTDEALVGKWKNDMRTSGQQDDSIYELLEQWYGPEWWRTGVPMPPQR